MFNDAETVVAIAVPGCAEYTRKQTDELTDWVKRPQIGMQGLAFIKCNADGTYKSSVDKFFTEDKLKAIADAAGAKAGDLVLILAGLEERTRKAISELRLKWAKDWDFVRKMSSGYCGYWTSRCLNTVKKTIAGLLVTTLLLLLSPIRSKQ
ncbi:GAD domain-containing protein [Paraflavitalea speifideaquila]|uniref:GAD domain-containing protein n=1 Tax=Paraflavitalea speifideaquila TaxID=3076558 RepID=UPI0028E55DD6|nr:GAD domain-containing protein [Paraflavitalea speifideiaquila]